MTRYRMKGLTKVAGILLVLTFVVAFSSMTYQANAGFFDWLIPQSNDYICKDQTINGRLKLNGYDSFTFDNCVVNGETELKGDINSLASFKNSLFNGKVEIECPTMVTTFENTKINGDFEVCEDIPPANDNGWVVEGVDCDNFKHKTKWKELTNAEICINITNTYGRDRDFVAGIDFQNRGINSIDFGMFKKDAILKRKIPVYGNRISYTPRNATYPNCILPKYVVDSDTCGEDFTNIVGFKYEEYIGFGVEDKSYTDVGSIKYEMEPFKIESGKTETIYIDVLKDASTYDYLKFDLYTYEDGTVIYTTQDPWFNSDWAYRRTVTITNDDNFEHTNETITVNLTHNGLADANCSDIRVTNSGDVEIPRTTMATLVDWIDNGKSTNTTLLQLLMKDYYYVNSTDCTIMFWATIPASSSTNYYIYYNNTGIGEPTQTEFPFEILDTFEQDANNANPSRWDTEEIQANEDVYVTTLKAVAGTKSVRVIDQSNLYYTGFIGAVFNSTNFTSSYAYYLATASTFAWYSRLQGYLTDYTTLGFYAGSTKDLNAWRRTIISTNSTHYGACSDTWNTTSGCLLTTNVPNTNAGAIGKLSYYLAYGHDSPFDDIYVDNLEITNGVYYINASTTTLGSEIAYSGDLLIYNNVTTNNSLDFYYGDFFSTNITAVNNSAGSTVGGVWFEFNNTNFTGTNISTISGYNGGIHNFNTTFYHLTPDTSYEVKQFVESVADGANYTNTSTFFTFNYYWLNNNTATLSINPSWTVDANTETEVECIVGNGNATLYRDSIEVTNPENTTLGGGSYNYTCVASSYGYYNKSDQNDLSVLSGFFLNNLDMCGNKTYSTYKLYAINETGDSYTNNSIGVGDRVDWYALPLGNTQMRIVNDETIQNYYYFNITVNDTMYETRNISLYRKYIMDIDVQDETTNSPISFDISIYNSTGDFANATDVTNFTGTWDTLPHGDVTIEISNSTDDYITRFYHETITQCSDINKTLYMLSATEGQYLTFNILGTNENPISGADVLIERLISGTWTEIDNPETDATGGATSWLDPDVNYRITVTASGYAQYQTVIRPIQSVYYIYLGSDSGVDTSFLLRNIEYFWYPSTSMLYLHNKTETNFDYNVNFSMFSSDSQIDNFYMNIVWNDTIVWTNSSAKSDGDTFYAYFNITGNITEDDRLYGTVYMQKDGYTQTYLINRNYILRNETAGDSSLGVIIPSFNLSSTTGGFLIILLAIFVGIIVSRFTTIWWVGGSAILLVLIIGTYLEYINVIITFIVALGLIGWSFYTKGGS